MNNVSKMDVSAKKLKKWTLHTHTVNPATWKTYTTEFQGWHPKSVSLIQYETEGEIFSQCLLVWPRHGV